MMNALKNAETQGTVVPTPEMVDQYTTDEKRCQKCGKLFDKGLTMHMRFCKGQ